MKSKLLFILAISILTIACSEHACPAYGSHYSYSPPKKKAFKMKSSASGKRSAKKAEQ